MTVLNSSFIWGGFLPKSNAKAQRLTQMSFKLIGEVELYMLISLQDSICQVRTSVCNIEPLVMNGSANDYQIKGTLGITAQLSDRDVHRPDRLRPRCWLYSSWC